MNRIEVLKRLNMLQYYILDTMYIEDWDGDDQETGIPIIRKIYRGLKEDEIKSLLKDITDIIQLVKEEE